MSDLVVQDNLPPARRRGTANDGAACASVGRDERLRNEVGPTLPNRTDVR
jgi:hypothetical protein